MDVLGIDIGGSGIKGAIVDVTKGEFTTERHRIPTPKPAKPQAVAEVVKEIIEHFRYTGKVGVTFPAIVRNNTAHSAANIDTAFIGVNLHDLFYKVTGLSSTILNDADAAGIAEMTFGCGQDHTGTVIILTLGTGVGSAMFCNNVLFPNSELGHIYLKNGITAEEFAANRIRKTKDLTWKEWGKRVNKVFQHIDFIFSPDLIIVGGGVSKYYEDFFPYINVEAELQPATLRNHAGIIGAALSAYHSL